MLTSSDVSQKKWLTDRLRVDSIRGIACLLLVFNHTVVDFSTYNGQELSALRGINALLSDIRMPLFSFISGLIFAYHAERSSKLGFLEGKAQRLLIPFVVMTVILLGMKAAYPSASVPVSFSELPYYLVYGYSHLWFLQAIFLIFVFYAALHATFRVQYKHYFVIFAGSLVMYFSPLSGIDFFSFGKAVYLLPFFTLGMIVTGHVNRHGGYQTPVVGAISLCFATSMALAIYSDLTVGKHSEVNSIIVGFSFLLLIYALMPRVLPLHFVGRYSFTIFLFHSMFIALGIRLFPENPASGIALTMAYALMGSILIEVVVDRYMPILGFGIGKGFTDTKRKPGHQSESRTR